MADAEKKCLLDLIPDGPTYSDVFEFGRPGQSQRYMFRLLDVNESAWCIVAAQRRSLEMLRDQFDKETALDLLKNNPPNIDLHQWWQECYALQAALCAESGAPVAEGTADERAYQIADKFDPIERHELAELYAEFADEHDPTELSDEQVREIIATEGPMAAPDFWKGFGSRALRRLCLILGQKLAEANARLRAMEPFPGDPETSQIDKSTAG